MSIRDEARAEAEGRFGAIGAVAFVEGYIAGANRAQADRDPSDAEVLDSARAVLSEMQNDLDFDPEYDYWEDAMRYAQAALLAAQEVRRG